MPNTNEFQPLLAFDKDVTISQSQVLSDAVDISGASLVGVKTPATWTTANLTLQASTDNTSFLDMYDGDGNEVTVTAGADRYINLNPADFASLRFIKLRSGTSGSTVSQTGNRTLTLICRPV